jgi:hypothetical protein
MKMGLDMYLDKEVYLPWADKEALPKLEKLGFKGAKIIVLRGMYWRKANAIHAWFVDNVQGGNDDCGRYYVSRKELRQLLDTVNDVLEDNSKACELLPVRKGFFFGSYEYDRDYFHDLEATKEYLDRELASNEDKYDYYYHSSW